MKEASLMQYKHNGAESEEATRRVSLEHKVKLAKVKLADEKIGLMKETAKRVMSELGVESINREFGKAVKEALDERDAISTNSQRTGETFGQVLAEYIGGDFYDKTQLILGEKEEMKSLDYEILEKEPRNGTAPDQPPNMLAEGDPLQALRKAKNLWKLSIKVNGLYLSGDYDETNFASKCYYLEILNDEALAKLAEINDMIAKLDDNEVLDVNKILYQIGIKLPEAEDAPAQSKVIAGAGVRGGYYVKETLPRAEVKPLRAVDIYPLLAAKIQNGIQIDDILLDDAIGKFVIKLKDGSSAEIGKDELNFGRDTLLSKSDFYNQNKLAVEKMIGQIIIDFNLARQLRKSTLKTNKNGLPIRIPFQEVQNRAGDEAEMRRLIQEISSGDQELDEETLGLETDRASGKNDKLKPDGKANIQKTADGVARKKKSKISKIFRELMGNKFFISAMFALGLAPNGETLLAQQDPQKTAKDIISGDVTSGSFWLNQSKVIGAKKKNELDLDATPKFMFMENSISYLKSLVIFINNPKLQTEFLRVIKELSTAIQGNKDWNDEVTLVAEKLKSFVTGNKETILRQIGGPRKRGSGVGIDSINFIDGFVITALRVKGLNLEGAESQNKMAMLVRDIADILGGAEKIDELLGIGTGTGASHGRRMSAGPQIPNTQSDESAESAESNSGYATFGEMFQAEFGVDPNEIANEITDEDSFYQFIGTHFGENVPENIRIQIGVAWFAKIIGEQESKCTLYEHWDKPAVGKRDWAPFGFNDAPGNFEKWIKMAGLGGKQLKVEKPGDQAQVLQGYLKDKWKLYLPDIVEAIRNQSREQIKMIFTKMTQNIAGEYNRGSKTYGQELFKKLARMSNEEAVHQEEVKAVQAQSNARKQVIETAEKRALSIEEIGAKILETPVGNGQKTLGQFIREKGDITIIPVINEDNSIKAVVRIGNNKFEVVPGVRIEAAGKYASMLQKFGRQILGEIQKKLTK
ncbi:MAG: hypothetical protein NTZ80_02585 [Patescibacteria group bacterium]|nr:hypothetical protein [Patescibacteria group bacterium]